MKKISSQNSKQVYKIEFKSSHERVKTTLLIDKTLKKLAQVYGVQHDMTLQQVVEEGLRKVVL